MTSGSRGSDCSALEKRGIEEVWQAITDFKTCLPQRSTGKSPPAAGGGVATSRLKKRYLLFARTDFDRYFQQTLQAVKNNDLSPRTGLRHISEFIQNHYFRKENIMSYQYVNVIIQKVAVIEFNYARKLNALSKCLSTI
jgi:hypothetical protein